MSRRTLGLINRIALDEQTGCWNWRGALSPKTGYGAAWHMGRFVTAHRLAAILWLGLKEGDSRCVLHRCDNTKCFNPKHLFLGTQLDNISDALAKGRFRTRNKDIPSCKRGHPFTQENIYPRPGGRRECHECIRLRNNGLL